ncbi:hypothetical protein K1T71_014577 [Dendrolimus kikuchii]|uniref:Uncharacterized protein n=1 Tax=Dendrolimus kikuchii TaxID=765133 RepID=A0ACC1CER4_9NEOP|nr:hypothetical protein K1T71_014577 [Dendrolimus kikuchii]
MAPTHKGVKGSSMNKLRYDMVINYLETGYALCQGDLVTFEQKQMFKLRCADLDSNYEQFVELHLLMEAESSDDFNSDEHKVKFNSVTDIYYAVKLKYLSLFPQNVIKQECPEMSVNFNHHTLLPKVQIPTFTGKIEDYAHFIDLFESIIGSQNTLSDTQKMYYLFGALGGEAKSLGQHLSITGDNYSVLLDILKSRYGNKRLQADRLLNTLLAITSVNKSLSSLKNFLNILLETTKGLEKLQFPVQHWSYLLLHINLNKLDTSLKRDFEDKYSEKDLPTFDDFIAFLTRHVQILETANINRPTVSTKLHSHVTTTNQGDHAFGGKCFYCKNLQHHLSKCDKFIKLKPFYRKQLVSNNHLCFRCLNKHNINECRSTMICNKCQSDKHHFLLHFDFRRSENQFGSQARGHTEVTPALVPAVAGPSGQSSASGFSTQPPNVLHAVSATTARRAVLLSTAVVRVLDNSGNYQEARALIDGGSQSTFITKECVTRLGLRVKRLNNTFNISGIGGKRQACDSSVILRISPRHVDQGLITSGLVINKISRDLPSCSLPSNLLEYYSGLNLADNQFYKSRKIDILLGADIINEILLNGDIVRVQGMPLAMNTIFGYILMGPVSCTENNNTQADISQSFHVSTDTLLEKFWEVEEIPGKVVNPKDDECETYFKNTYERDESGRYVVRLPFLSDAPKLGDSKQQALKRFFAMEKRLQANALLREKYVQFMKEYQDMGHMTPCTDIPQYSCYIIPHHGIFKANSDKIRCVFDGSCRTSSGVSLNDCLHAGPKLQQDIMKVICLFRLFKVVITSDIKMMFRMIKVHEDDKKYQLIFWRESPELPLQLFKLNTITYGLKSSPYLAIRSLRQLADDSELEYPDIAQVLRTSVYTDDILAGANNLKEAQKLKQNLVNVLSSGGFELRKWLSNDKRLLQDIPADYREKPHIFDSDTLDFVKILGIQWNPVADTFTYHTTLDEEKSCTKRMILSTLARMFNPMGWISPVILQGKVLMQKLWSLQLAWDDKPPPNIIAEWTDICKSLPMLRDLSLERFVLADNMTACSLHGFSDASELGYGAAVYIRSVNRKGNVKVSLLMAKTRVAPLKFKLTIPKMELSGAALLVKLLNYIYLTIKDRINIEEIFCWSDSTITLSWLRISPHLLQTFEGNRVSQIINCGLDIKWRHLPSELNPADVASRGCRAHELVSHRLWWAPEWLFGNADTWPVNIIDKVSDIPGMRKQCITSHAVQITSSVDLSLFSKYSSLSKLIAVVGYCFRFLNNTRYPLNKLKGVLSVAERQGTLNRLIKLAQLEKFSREIELLEAQKPCSVRLRRLMPFIDEDGLIRVGGRLELSNLPFAAKHPVLLPKSHKLTSLIIDYHHKLHCHIGATALQAILQQNGPSKLSPSHELLLAQG